MGGFKEGTVNGWDDEADDTPDPSTESAPDETASETGLESVSVDADSDSNVDTAAASSTASSDIPWILRRNSITDGREQTVQLHLQEETMNVQRTQKSIIESRLGESVRKADLREAALLVGLQHTDDVVDVLKEWGYALE
jgi:hypothetical protein